MVTDFMRRVFLGLAFLACVSLFGSAFYYTSIVTIWTMTATALFAALATLGMGRMIPLVNKETARRAVSTVSYVNLCVFLLGIASLGVFIFLAATHPITTATRSLWLLFSPAHIALLGIAFVCFLILDSRQGDAMNCVSTTSVLGALLAFATTSLAALLFPLGFGFDPFLHRATLEHIATFGTITPKPLYYIGAYILELFGNLLLHIPLFPLDVFLAPVGFALITWIGIRGKVLHPAMLALLPFAAFISTTPQAIGFLWVFATVLALRLKLPEAYAILFALAACAAHPLAGIPAVMLVVLHIVCDRDKARTLSLFLITLLGVFAIPLLFLVQHLLTGADVGFTWAAFTDFSRIPHLGFFSLHGNPLLDTVMLLGGNLFFITCALALVGFIKSVRGRERTEQYETVPYILAAIIALGNFVILSIGFNFPFLISYERTDFALRLVTIAWIFLLPVASDGMHILGALLKTQETTRRAVSTPPFANGGVYSLYALTLLLIIFSANVYVTYPRHDGYTRSAAFNATAADEEIVHRIAEDAGDTPYVVLSNQTLASVAIQEFGFFRYYHNELFAYPIPTSGPLYALFLNMIEDTPNLAIVQQARDLTGASRVYFVVHSYWWEADERIAEAKKITDDWFTSADSTITVLIFADVSR
jgi:hypothetical protein